MYKVFKKYQNFIKDFFVNSVSFAIYIFSQQIILMPIMGKLLPENDFSKLILFISIFSIISNTLGSELGIVRQIREEKDKVESYNKTLKILIILSFIISIACISFLGYDLLTTIIFAFVTVFANIRLYASAFYRMNKNFKYVMYQNIIYLLGLIAGIVIFKYTNLVWMPSLFAEILALIFSMKTTDISFATKKDQKTSKKTNKDIISTFKNYSLIELMINLMTYFDKILIYPILGSKSVNTYYTTTTMSKIISLITNPLQGVILSWIKKDDKKSKQSIMKLILKFSVPVIFIVSIISVPLTYFAVKFLYNSFLEDSIPIIIPISIGIGFSFISTIIKSILLKYIPSKKLLGAYIAYLISFAALSLSFSYFFSLFGFAMANMISKIILFVIFLIILRKTIQKEKEEYVRTTI